MTITSLGQFCLFVALGAAIFAVVSHNTVLLSEWFRGALVKVPAFFVNLFKPQGKPLPVTPNVPRSAPPIAVDVPTFVAPPIVSAVPIASSTPVVASVPAVPAAAETPVVLPTSKYEAGTSIADYLAAHLDLNLSLKGLLAGMTSLALTKEQLWALNPTYAWLEAGGTGPTPNSGWRPEWVNCALTPQGIAIGPMVSPMDTLMVVPLARAAEVVTRFEQKAFIFALNPDGVCISYVPVADVPGVTSPAKS